MSGHAASTRQGKENGRGIGRRRFMKTAGQAAGAALAGAGGAPGAARGSGWATTGGAPASRSGILAFPKLASGGRRTCTPSGSSLGGYRREGSS